MINHCWRISEFRCLKILKYGVAEAEFLKIQQASRSISAVVPHALILRGGKSEAPGTSHLQSVAVIELDDGRIASGNH